MKQKLAGREIISFLATLGEEDGYMRERSFDVIAISDTVGHTEIFCTRSRNPIRKKKRSAATRTDVL